MITVNEFKKLSFPDAIRVLNDIDLQIHNASRSDGKIFDLCQYADGLLKAYEGFFNPEQKVSIQLHLD